MALAALKESGGGDGRMISYDGGAPATLAAAGGEAQATTQLASEQAELIKAGKLRPLAALSEMPLVIEGIDPIPPITNWLPDMNVSADYFGILIPAGAPQEVYDTVDAIWQDKVMNSAEFKKYAGERGAFFDPSFGEAALEKAMPVIITEACARVARDEAVIDPGRYGINCDTMTVE
jgi:tripartite-type tricarboxylate transporter receptor subunit TctC